MRSMSRRTWTELLGVCIVVGAACHLLSSRAEEHARQASRVLESARWELAQGQTTWSDEAVALIRERSKAARDALRDGSSFERDESLLYARWSELAAKHAVQIDQLVPSTTSSASGASATPTSTPDGHPVPSPMDSRKSYSVTIQGPYANMTNFVDDVERSAGFSVVRSLRLMPSNTPGTGSVRAILVTEHFGIDFADQLPGGTR